MAPIIINTPSQEAQIAYNNDQNIDGTGNGGIYLLVTLKLIHLVYNFGHIRSGNAQWIHFHGVLGIDIVVLNVYAPHMPFEGYLFGKNSYLLFQEIVDGYLHVIETLWNKIPINLTCVNQS